MIKKNHCHQCNCECHEQEQNGYCSEHECCDKNECSSEHEDHEDLSARLLEMADDAWMEVLKEKIKEHIINSHSEHLDQLAQIVSDTNGKRWKDKMAMKKNCNEFKEKLCQLFDSK